MKFNALTLFIYSCEDIKIFKLLAMISNTRAWRFISYLCIVSGFTCGNSLNHSLYAQTYIMPVSDQQITLDGSDRDWYKLQKYSAEYHQSGPVSSRKDLQGEVSLTLSNRYLYALTCMQDDQGLIHTKMAGIVKDQILLLLQVKKKSIELKLTLDPSINRSKWLKTVGVSKQAVQWAITPNTSQIQNSSQIQNFSQIPSSKQIPNDTSSKLCVEWKVSLQMLPDIYGKKIKFSALFFDVDFIKTTMKSTTNTAHSLKTSPSERVLEQEISVYASHLVSKRQRNSFKPKALFVLGGNLVFKHLYENTKNRRLKSIKRIREQWVGDSRLEEIHSTNQEIVVLGADLPCGGGYCEWVHGWGSASQVVSMSLYKHTNDKYAQLHVIHKEPIKKSNQKIKWVYILEIYSISSQGFHKRFAQMIQVDTRNSSIKTEWKMSHNGQFIYVKPAVIEPKSKLISLDDLPSIIDVKPLLIKRFESISTRYELTPL
jgi:hypothetical protein